MNIFRNSFLHSQGKMNSKTVEQWKIYVDKNIPYAAKGEQLTIDEKIINMLFTLSKALISNIKSSKTKFE